MKIQYDTRDRLYDRQSVRSALIQAGGRGKTNVDRLRNVDHTVHGGTLDELLDGSVAFDPKISLKIEEGIHVIGGAYRVPASKTQFVTSYGYHNVVNALAANVLRSVYCTQNSAISNTLFIQHQVTPEKVMQHLVKNLHGYESPKIAAGMRWRPTDGMLRVLSLYRAVQGMEMKALSDVAAYRYLDNKPHWADHAQQYASSNVDLDTIPVEQRDLIIKAHAPRGHKHAWGMQVPVRHGEGYHTVQITNVPVLPADDDRRFVMPFALRGRTDGRHEQMFREGRRHGKNYTKETKFLTAHEMAGYMAVATMSKKKDERVWHGMVPYAKQQMLNFVDQLRHNVYIAENEEIRQLNGTEIENLMWRRIFQTNWEDNFTMDRDKLTKEDIGAILKP